jgi:D-cysteine desulfhydrase
MTLPPRFPLAITPTPLQRASRLERLWGSGPLWIKRDDMTGFGAAGNKARPLEFLIADALAGGADTVVATGGVGSNFCAAAALAAHTAGLQCDVVYAGDAPQHLPVTVRLAHAAGAHLTFLPGVERSDLDDAVAAHARSLADQGRRPYALPRGGATAMGAVGFAAAAGELIEQCAAEGITECTVVLPTGSGCSQAGLVAGLASASNLTATVVGASVSRPPDVMRTRVANLARECASLLHVPAVPDDAVLVRDARRSGFGQSDPELRRIAAEALRTAGILLDGTYGAKALAVARDIAQQANTPVIFWHTGGLPKALVEVGADPS